MTTTDRITLDQFIEEQNITADVKWGAPKYARPIGDHMNGWTVTLTRAAGGWRQDLVVPFFTGQALGQPEARDVLECLALDASTVESSPNYWDWIDEYGQEPSRESGRAHTETVEQSQRLREWLGTEAYEQLLWNVDTD